MKTPSQHSSLLIQFAKWPQLGQVKTRMQPLLSESQSLALHRELLVACHRQVYGQGDWAYQLCLAGHPASPEAGALLPDAAAELQLSPEALARAQCSGDLGDKMRFAASEAFVAHQAVVIIGSDCPFVSADYVAQAFATLAGGADVVFGPASDGGYVLVGLSARQAPRTLPAVFADMPWSQPQLLEHSCQKLQAAELKVSLLDTLSDIDRPEDLALLQGGPLEPHSRQIRA